LFKESTMTAFIKEFGRSVGPIRMEDGVRYRYVDPKALAAERNSAWVGFGGLLFMGAMFGFFGVISYGKSDLATQWFCWGLAGACALGGLACLLWLKKEREDKASVNDVVWTIGDRLYVERAGRVAEFPTPAVLTKTIRKDRHGHVFMSWHEVYANDRGRYRLDRRYLWPEGKEIV
jgi:hypothetical protein